MILIRIAQIGIFKTSLVIFKGYGEAITAVTAAALAFTFTFVSSLAFSLSLWLVVLGSEKQDRYLVLRPQTGLLDERHDVISCRS